MSQFKKLLKTRGSPIELAQCGTQSTLNSEAGESNFHQNWAEILIQQKRSKFFSSEMKKGKIRIGLIMS